MEGLKELQKKQRQKLKGFSATSYVNNQKNQLPELALLSDEDLQSVAHCIESLCAHYCGEYPGGGFVQAVVGENFIEIAGKADFVNALVWKIYAGFIYNFIDMRLREYFRKDSSFKSSK